MDPINPITPPAFVQEATSARELIAQAHRIAGQITEADKLNLGRAAELGKILARLKESCAYGKWLATVDQIGVSKSRAYEYLKLARVPARELLECESIREALELHGNDPDPPPAELFCDRCQRVGPVKDCKACQKLRAPQKASAKTGGTTQREPGDDTEQIKADEQANKKARRANGQIAFDKKQFGNEFGALVREIDRVGNAYRAKETPEAEGLRKQLDEWRKGFLKWVGVISKTKKG